ncbi:MAG: NAD(P)/FAD-dependent oxidoreductase [Firmicutes bacterium]|nr:NAD(P)/FAD-dependent oxidoreductase [Bacillota bacterium]
MRNEVSYDIAIVGGGAAGLMAAIAARSSRNRSLRIAVVEKNEKAGKKLYATGNGRCNLLNRTADAKDYRSGKGDAAGFTASVLEHCGPEAMRQVFAHLGWMPWKRGKEGFIPAACRQLPWCMR